MGATKIPKVSVITTLYNYAHYIGACIESFLNQDFIDSELVIIDDCSTDNPNRVLSEYTDPRIRYRRLSSKANYTFAKNEGIRNARAGTLVLLDADDMLTKNGISTRFEKLQQGFDFVHGPCLELRKGLLSRDPAWKKWLENNISTWVHAQAVMYRKSIHSKIGLYDTALWASSDREMFNRIFDAGYKIGTVDKDVAIYRIHPQQMHRSSKKQGDKPRLKELIKQVRVKRRAGDYSGLEMLKC